MNGKTLTGEGLEKALKNDDFSQRGPELIGMVKASDQAKHISIAILGCDRWIDVPVTLIEEAESIGHKKCEGHSHPVFRMRLKEMKTPAHRFLSTMLGQQLSGPHGGLGIGVQPTNVAYWPTNDGFQCVGFWDCINMINTEYCREVKCYTGWVTGEVTCICLQ